MFTGIKQCEKEKRFVKKCEEIRKKLEGFGYTLLSVTPKQYRLSKAYIVNAICENGHEFKKDHTTYISRCPICEPRRLWNEDSIRYWLQENRSNLDLISYDFESKRASLKCKLDGYTFNPDWAKFKSANSNCQKCSNSARLMIDDFVNVYSAKGYIVDIDEQTTTRTRIPTTCPKGHFFYSNIIRFRDRGDRCPKCQRQNQASRGEKAFADWLEGIGYKVERNNRSILNGLEIDCYLSEFQIGIEHNGLYYHSEVHLDYNKQYEKFKRSLKKGIHLLQFWEDEFIDKLDILKSIVLVKLKHSSIQRIFARKCAVRTVLRKEAKRFIEENHLQGFRGKEIKGLYYKDDLVMLVTYTQQRKQTGVVLQSVVSKKYTQVVGGLSKLLKQIPIRPIIAWSDNLYSIGAAYRAIGFTLEQELRPDYQYFKNMGRLNYKRFSKQSLKKTKAECKAQSYYRIFDAGKRCWRLNNR